MSRYRMDGPIPQSTTAHIYGPDGQVLGKVYRADDPESLRLVRFIEAHDEIIDVLSDAAYDYGDQAINLIEMRALLKRLDVYSDKLNEYEKVKAGEMDALVERLEGEEAI